MRGLAIAALDTVQVNVSRYGLSNYAFNVAGWRLSLDPEWSGVTMHLVEDNEEIYEWAVADETAPPDAAPTIVQPGATDTDNTSPLNTALISLSYVVGLAVTGHDAGSDASITIPTHDRIYSDKSVSVTGDTITGLAFATTYYIYYDDASRVGGAVTFETTTVQTDSVASTTNDDRHFVATITTPADGAGDTIGYGALPPGFNYGWSW
jgi:hypothetical protein